MKWHTGANNREEHFWNIFGGDGNLWAFVFHFYSFVQGDIPYEHFLLFLTVAHTKLRKI